MVSQPRSKKTSRSLVGNRRARWAGASAKVFMSLESGPTCGDALSTIGNQCRHRAASFIAVPSRPFDAKYLPRIIAAVASLSVLAYRLFANELRRRPEQPLAILRDQFNP